MDFKKCLVLGGAGFIGMNIVKQLSKRKNYKITIADNFSRGKNDEYLKSIVEKHKIKVISGDFTNPKTFKSLESNYEYVYMLASVVGVEYTQKIPNEIIRINTALIFNTMEWIKTTKCKKILFTSTSECYAGAVESFKYHVPTSEKVPLCINDITEPRFTYAVTKMLGESGFINYSRVFDFECTVVRYHNVYGPRMGFKHVIPQVIQRFLNKESPFKVFGHNQTRSFNYVDDAVNGTIAAMESKNTNREIFHIGDMSAEITIEELVHFIGNTMKYSGVYENKESHPGSVSRRCPNTQKAEKILGYKPKVKWKDGVNKTIKWYTEYISSGKNIFE